MLKVIMSKVKQVLKDRQGEAVSIGFTATAFIMIVLFLMGVDFFVYSAIKQNMDEVASETLTLMKIENGYDSSTRDNMLVMMGKLNLDVSKISIKATPKEVQRGDLVEITMDSEYESMAFKPLGQSLKFPMHVYRSGYAQEFIRPGG